MPFDPFAVAKATERLCAEHRHAPAGPDAGPGRGGAAVGQFLGRCAQRQGRRQAARPPLRRPRMAGRSLFPLAARRLSARIGANARAGRGRRGRRERQGDGQFPARPISQRHLALQPCADQPRRHQADEGNQRRQPRPGLRQPPRGRGERQGHRPAPHRSRRLRKRRHHRRDAGRSGVPERPVPADPVHADHRQGRRRADALRAAAGEPLLHDRPRAAAEPRQVAGRRGPHRVRRSAGSTRPRRTRTRASRIMSSKASSPRSSRSAPAPRPRPICSLSALAGPWSRSRWRGSPPRGAARKRIRRP